MEGRHSSTHKLLLRENERSFRFGFNDVDFSDRVLRLEIIPSNTNPGCHKYVKWFSSLDDDANGSELVKETKVKTVHISCILLAAKSLFFYKLFKNGMRESKSRDHITLKINASEEAALMDLLNFIYDIPLNATSSVELVDVFMAADKFEVPSCMRHCIERLLDLPMSVESALFYLELPSSALVGELVQPLLDAAKKYVSAHFRDFTKSKQQAAMALPLSALQVVLGSDGLKVKSEDVILNFILDWARKHYPKLEERRENLSKHLVPFICFPYISCSKLNEVLGFPDFDYEQVSKLVVNALSLKVEAPFPYGQHLPASKDRGTTEHSFFPRRVYDLRLIKVVAFEAPQPRCIVYLNLTKEDYTYLLASHSHELHSHTFCLGGRRLLLMAQCVDKQKFGLYVKMEGSESCSLDLEFAVMMKSSYEFRIFLTTNVTLTDTQKIKGTQSLFKITWTDFMSDESDYFIDGILHLRAQITMKN